MATTDRFWLTYECDVDHRCEAPAAFAAHVENDGLRLHVRACAQHIAEVTSQWRVLDLQRLDVS